MTYAAAPLVGEGVDGCVVVFRDITAKKHEQRRRVQELDELSWVGRVRDALREDRLVLYAQPVIDIVTNTVTSHELLLRLIATDGEVVSPGKFLPAAERFDLIQDIDRWVARQAIELAAKGHRLEFNISGRSLGDADLLTVMADGLSETGADASLLVCEITETALAAEPSISNAFVSELSKIGFRVALDDFGTGYGGFTYLKHLPVDFIKIDTEFIRDLVSNPQSRHVVRAVVSLARAFGQTTIAEGVEHAELLSVLGDLGVDQAQGYGIGKPRSVGEVVSAMRPIRSG
jgi:EAL domain-containing protein (putative c-di-GMP-specific phosphodiesterase class I)